MMKTSRRNLIKSAGFAAAGLALAVVSCGEGSNRESDASPKSVTADKSRVAIVRRPADFPLGEKVNPEPVERLLDAVLQSLFDIKDPREGLREIFHPDDIVGIKVNCLSGRKMSTHPQLALAMAAMLGRAGVKPDNIIIWDRSDGDLQRAGFKLNRGQGIKIYGVDSSGYGRELMIHRSIGSFIANIMERTDIIVNLPVLKDHGIVGVTLSLKNFFGAIHNPNKYHPNGGDPYIADLYSHPLFKDKVKLNIVDGIVGQYEGGPPYQPQWRWNFGGLIAGTDPVAVDRVGLDIIEEQRRLNGVKSLAEAGRYPHYLETAEKLGIGNFDRGKIKIIE